MIRPSQRILLSLALLVSASAFADTPAADTQPDPNAEVEVVDPNLVAFRATRDRFLLRMSELEKDTEYYVDLRERQERSKLESGYDDLISTLTELELSKRDQAVEVFEEFLRVYPDAPYSSHVRFRLAELYFEVQQETWFQNMKGYSVLEEKCFQEEIGCDELPEQPYIDLQPAIDLYDRIIADNKDLPKGERYEYLDAVYYMLGFAYNEPNSAQFDDTVARQAFQGLVEVEFDSPLADAANLILGNFAFDDNELDLAIDHYRTVFEKGKEGKYYGDSLYQLAWAHYRKALTPEEYDGALELFHQVLEYSDEQLRETGRVSDYRPDAVKYMAISFNDLADINGTSPIEVAKAYFAKGDPREYEWDVFVALGDVLETLNKTEDGIDLYIYLQEDERWVFKPENPEFQMKVVKLWTQGAFPDLEASGRARVELTEKYNDQSAWWEANRANPEALAKAREYIEGSLSDVAIEYRLAADETQTPSDYATSAERFREYLDKFPMSDDYYKMQWYLADTLYSTAKAGEGNPEYETYFDQAIEEYELLMKSRRAHEYGDGAVFQLMRARNERLTTRFGSLEERPESAVLERSYDRLDNKKDTETGEVIKVDVYTLPEEHTLFIEAADRALDWRFRVADGEDNPYFTAVEENRPALMYLPAQILFHHHRFEEARPRLRELVDEHRDTVEASYAAGLIVDSYMIEGDLAKVRLWTTEFIRNPPGPVEMQRVEDFENLLEGTAFKQCLQFVEADDREGGAECFMQFIVDFPKSEHVNVALYNAANSYQLVGKADRANELFEEYVNTYPDDEKSEFLYFRIATNYESTFDLQQAISYYERLVKLFPENVDAAAAWYNAAFLKIGLGDHRGAAKAFEAYPSKFPDQADIEKVFFMAGESWEQVGEREAKRFYTSYLNDSRWTDKSPDHRFTAMFKLAERAEKDGRTREYDQWLDTILDEFNKVAAKNPEALGNKARFYAAQAAFRPVWARFQEITSEKLTGNEEKDLKILTETKPAEIREFTEMAKEIYAYKDFDYTIAATYVTGAIQMYFADLGFSLQCPSNFGPDECDIFMEIVDTQIFPQFFPVQEEAVKLLEKAIATGRDRKRHSEWIDKAQDRLNQYNPKDYPAAKLEIRGGTDATIYPEIKPLEMAAPTKEEVVDQSDLPPSMRDPEPSGGNDGPSANGGGQ